jgi:hypothetical protein
LVVVTVGFLAVHAAAEDQRPLQTMQEKMSYTFGFDMGKTLVRQGVPLETNLVLQGFHDGLLRATPALSESDMAAALAACQAVLKARQIEWRQSASTARRQAGAAAAAAANAASALTVAGPDKLPDGTIAANYAQALVATGGTMPRAWSLAAGALPGGLTLSATGVISGTPTARGNFPFTAQIRDGLGNVSTKAFSITVNGP